MDINSIRAELAKKTEGNFGRATAPAAVPTPAPLAAPAAQVPPPQVTAVQLPADAHMLEASLLDEALPEGMRPDAMLQDDVLAGDMLAQDAQARDAQLHAVRADDLPLPPVMAASRNKPAPAAKVRTQLKLPSRSGGLMSLFKKPVAWVRRHPRHPCVIIGVLDILDRTVPLDGLVTEISEGGALFRTASMYIFDRRRSPIALRFADREWRGEIVNVKAEGYGIRLDHNITLDEIETVIAKYGMPGAVAA